MKKFFRAILLFLQCLITWPWGIPLAAIFVLKTKWLLRDNPEEWLVYWGGHKNSHERRLETTPGLGSTWSMI